jgi:hypothetical protein
MTEVKLADGKGEAQRIADRLKPSASPNNIATQVQTGTGPTRTITTVHHGGHQGEHK